MKYVEAELPTSYLLLQNEYTWSAYEWCFEIPLKSWHLALFHFYIWQLNLNKIYLKQKNYYFKRRIKVLALLVMAAQQACLSLKLYMSYLRHCGVLIGLGYMNKFISSKMVMCRS